MEIFFGNWDVIEFRRHISISKKYALDILYEFGQLGSSPPSIPMKHNISSSENEVALKDVSSYRKIDR